MIADEEIEATREPRRLDQFAPYGQGCRKPS